MKRLFLFFVILNLLVLNSGEVASQITINKVVIDAGHRGKDPGAMGKSSKEKDIVLAIALKTGAYIEKYIPGVDVIYTRTNDKFVELYKRAQIANDNQADLFISIHCNSNPSSNPHGAETYVMGLHKSKANLEIAKKENAAILQEENYAHMYEGFDPNQDEDYVTLSLFQNAFLDQSLDVASRVQDQFRDRVGLTDRGVKQAGFWVLYKTAMPGILIEVGFLSNLKEEKFLLTDDGQAYVASAIYRAFKEYRRAFQKENSSAISLINNEESINIDQLFFRVQFLSSPNPRSLNATIFEGIADVAEYYHKGLYKYTAGNMKTIEAAAILKKKLIESGFGDAFIVSFLNNDRISINEAKQYLEK